MSFLGFIWGIYALFYPPFPPCQWTEGRTSLEEFFFYTPAPARAVFKTDEYMRVWAGWEQHKKGVWLRLVIEIQDEDAQNIFGGIDAGAQLQLETLKGEQIRLTAAKNSAIIQQKNQNKVRFETWWVINQKLKQQLLRESFGSIGIEWARGDQSYDLFDTDFLRRLSACLN